MAAGQDGDEQPVDDAVLPDDGVLQVSAEMCDAVHDSISGSVDCMVVEGRGREITILYQGAAPHPAGAGKGAAGSIEQALVL